MSQFVFSQVKSIVCVSSGSVCICFHHVYKAHTLYLLITECFWHTHTCVKKKPYKCICGLKRSSYLKAEWFRRRSAIHSLPGLSWQISRKQWSAQFAARSNELQACWLFHLKALKKRTLHNSSTSIPIHISEFNVMWINYSLLLLDPSISLQRQEGCAPLDVFKTFVPPSLRGLKGPQGF